jgi:hypothetical protein
MDLALNEDPYLQTPMSFPLLAIPCITGEESKLVVISKIPVKEKPALFKEKVEIATLAIEGVDHLKDLVVSDIRPPKFRKDNIFHYSVLPLSAGDYTCRVVIRNNKTGDAAVASSHVEIFNPPKKGVLLDPPLLLQAGDSGFYLKHISKEREKKNKKEEVFSLLSIFPFDASCYTPLVGEIPRGLKEIYAVVRCEMIQMPEKNIRVYARFFTQDNQEEKLLDFSILKKYKLENVLILFIKLEIDKLLPGDYQLNFIAEGKRSQTWAEVNTPIKVE